MSHRDSTSPSLQLWFLLKNRYVWAVMVLWDHFPLYILMLALHAGIRNSLNIILKMFLWKKRNKWQTGIAEQGGGPGGGGQTEKTTMQRRWADVHAWLGEKCPQSLSWRRIIIAETTFLTPQLWPLLWSLRGVVLVFGGYACFPDSQFQHSWSYGHTHTHTHTWGKDHVTVTMQTAVTHIAHAYKNTHIGCVKQTAQGPWALLVKHTGQRMLKTFPFAGLRCVYVCVSKCFMILTLH